MIYAALLARFSADKGLIPKPSKSRFYCVTGMQQRSDEAMAVFRVERNKGYTVMSNHHLRNKELSLKAKGLLSQMLSLPEDWDYTLAGLSFINREKIDAIREAVKELERAGYIVRSRERDEKGRLRGTDYVIFEQPQTPPVSDLPTLENPTLDNPTLEKPTQEKPTLENPTQLNKDIQKTDLPKKEKINTDLSSTDSIPIHSLNPLPYDGEAATPPERKRKEATDAYSVYEEIIKDNIEYDHFVRYGQVDKDRLDEIVSIILETVCSKRKAIRIAGDDYPAELVKAKFMKLNSSHIEFVFDCMKENTTKIRNIVKAKPRTLTVKSFTGKTYDGKPVANFTFNNLLIKFGAPTHDGVENFTSALDSGEKYVEFRRKGEVLWTKVTDKYIPKNAAEYEYRIGVTATDEWAAVVSEIKTFKISQVEIKLEKGYIATSAILQNGDLLYLATYTPVAGETITLRLVNGKAGLELSDTNPNYVKLDQKKQVSVQSNLDCFRLTSTSNANLSNYKIVKSAGQTKVEITVAPSEKGISKQITGKSESIDAANNKKLSMWTTVRAGSFQVGQTVIVSDSTGTKLFEAKIVRVGVVDPNGDGTYNITSQSGCVIPSDGKIRIEIDVTGITYDVNKVVGGSIRVK